MNTKFYFLEEEYEKKYACAYNETSEYQRIICKKCGGVKIVFEKKLEIEIKGKKKGNYYSTRGHFLIDSKLETILLQNNITGFDTKEIEHNNTANDIKEMIISGRVGFLRDKKGNLLKKCEECNKVIENYDDLIGTTICEEDWNGEDIFLIENYTGIPVVTQKVKELFEKNKIKNAKFVPIEEFELG